MKYKNFKIGNSLLYINIAVVFILVFIVFIIMKPLFAKKTISKSGVYTKARVVEYQASAPATYDISKIKKDTVKTDEKLPADLKEMYEKYPVADVGDNMVEEWARMSPEHKAKFVEALDGEIGKSENILKDNPEDKNAKNKLHIAKMLKKLSQDGFNYKIKKKE